MASLSAVSKSPVKSIQTGYLESFIGGNGTGEDSGYIDITVSAVDTTKTVIECKGEFGGSAMTTRMINATTLRLGSPTASNAQSYFVRARWQLLEFN